MDYKDFSSNWRISSFYSIFKLKIILSGVRLRRKMAFRSTRHRIWTYKRKNIHYIFWSESPIFINYRNFWMIQSGMSLSKGSVWHRLCLQGLKFHVWKWTKFEIWKFARWWRKLSQVSKIYLYYNLSQSDSYGRLCNLRLLSRPS